MLSTNDQKRLVGQLASAFWHTGEERLSKSLEELSEAAPDVLVQGLTKIEKTQGLPTGLWTLIVRAKGVIAGKVVLDDFLVEALKYQGLI